MKRRKFIRSTGQLGIGLAVAGCGLKPESAKAAIRVENTPSGPVSICTWGFVNANQVAGKALDEGKSALDAAIAGVSVEESDIKNSTVGKGGAPDREGRVTLDAGVMAPDGNAGSVVCVRNITHVASLARKVMEDTPHVMLAAEGAEQFALANGFAKENLLTPESEAKYREWLREKKYNPVINIESHDTIAILTLDQKGDLAGACTTSGLAYKMAGRVGDSAIIGSGLYVDNEIGAAAATGYGEEIMKQVGSFLIIELMRGGMSPQEACEEAIKRTLKKANNYKDIQVAYIAMNKSGQTGSFSLQEGFARMEYRAGKNERVESDSHFKN
jgi:N4-(beta-N-acetylglucosaminyl)-L-asparaginase